MERRIENGVTILTVSLKKERKNPYTGVYYNGKCKQYEPVMSYQGKVHRLGTYKNVEDAISIRKEAEAQVAAGTFPQWYEEWKQMKTK